MHGSFCEIVKQLFAYRKSSNRTLFHWSFFIHFKREKNIQPPMDKQVDYRQDVFGFPNLHSFVPFNMIENIFDPWRWVKTHGRGGYFTVRLLVKETQRWRPSATETAQARLPGPPQLSRASVGTRSGRLLGNTSVPWTPCWQYTRNASQMKSGRRILSTKGVMHTLHCNRKSSEERKLKSLNS